MNTSLGNTDTPQIAVWYFVGATFIFAAPVLFFRDADLWIRIVFLAAGFVAVIGGGVQLGREIRERRTRRSALPPHEDQTEPE